MQQRIEPAWSENIALSARLLATQIVQFILEVQDWTGKEPGSLAWPEAAQLGREFNEARRMARAEGNTDERE